jgi:hypothetical protein
VLAQFAQQRPRRVRNVVLFLSLHVRCTASLAATAEPLCHRDRALSRSALKSVRGAASTRRFAYNRSLARSVRSEARDRSSIEEESMILDVNEIQKILPHRYPFLMVDAILEMERVKRIVGIKNVSINEYYFQGHFPGKPIMPAVLIIEGMAQTGGLLLLLEVPDRENKLLYFVASK